MEWKAKIARASVRVVGALLPDAAVRRIFRHAAAGLNVAVCVHRVGRAARTFDPAPEMTAAPETLDRMLDLVTGATAQGRFTMTFDDGYADSVAYVAERAPKYPGVEWLIFVCPEKLTRRAGFRWDEYELRLRRGQPTPPFAVFMQRNLDVERENARPELREVAAQPEYSLATVAACKDVARLPNVELGGHTNAHFNLCMLSDEDAQRDLLRSTWDFVRTFGQPMRHFSFPFGTPGKHFADRHVAYVRGLGAPAVWATLDRPYAMGEQRAGTVRPRFGLPGDWSARAMVLWMSLQALRARVGRAVAPAVSTASAPLSAEVRSSSAHGQAARDAA